MTNCRTCNTTCHYPCEIPNNEDKHGCAAMKDGNCTICKGRCNWQEHSNMTFYFETKIVKEKGRADKLYEAYVDANSKKSKSE